LEEALTSAQNSGDRYYEAELYRLRGELLLLQATPGTPDAIACFQKAVEIARKQKAMSLELRAATSLARIYQTQGRREQGRDILAKIYRKFTEGFDTLDLLQANALLDQLT
jgi:predicted ATPase